MEILYEDKYFIAINKPAGLVVQGARKREESLFHKVKDFLKRRDKKPGEVFLAVVHRLDKPVSGALIFAKRSKSASKFFKLLQEKRVEKIYLAKVEGRWEEKYGVWEDYTEEGKRAITFFNLLKVFSRDSLLLLYPLTGRKHQLRRALAERGYPILGDFRYGSKVRIERGRAILLHSLFLKFPHPYTGEVVEIYAEPPSYFTLGLTLDKRRILEFLNKVRVERERWLSCVRPESG